MNANEESGIKAPYDIDMVYLWVDGNDPKWRAKRQMLDGNMKYDVSADCKGRYADNDELKYSLRALEMYAPWINHIYIVTDEQVPAWLDESNPRVTIVDHKDILPPEALPCFNSTVIEHFLSKIPGLSEHFLYGNDDMFFNREVVPGDFFGRDGLPVVRIAYRRPMRKLQVWYDTKVRGRRLNHYNHVIANAASLVEGKYGHYYGGKSHHNIDAYLKSDLEETRREFLSAIIPTVPNHIRCDSDIERHLYAYAAMARRRCHVEHVGRDTSFHLYIHRRDHYEKLDRHNPKFFCMNDSEYASDEDRERARAYLEERFPHKSSFEK